jgi:hypothetical protein
MNPANPLPVDRLRLICAEMLDVRHFIALLPLRLEWEHAPQEEIAWEVFRGQLVQPHLTRERRSFESWNVFAVGDSGRSGEPLLSLKWDAERGELHVVRGLLCVTWEGYHAGDGVFLSREVPRWVRELVGTLRPTKFAAEDDLRAELALRLFQAVVGMSRLPLTSVESPLPAFSLGQLAYFYNPEHLNHTTYRPGSTLERTKWLEFLLRATPAGELGSLADRCVGLWRSLDETGSNIVALLRSVFNEVALSPYTDFVDKTLEFLRLLVARQYLAVEQHVDFLSYLLRQLGRI